MDWKNNLIDDDATIADLLSRTHAVAVLGIKTEQQVGQPAFYVAQYLASAGLSVIPVPVYYPDITTILGRPVYRRLVDIPGPVDLVDVFRRPQDIPQHVSDILEKNPTAVWFQSGIINDEAAETLAKGGIKVIQDRCLMVEHRRLVK